MTRRTPTPVFIAAATLMFATSIRASGKETAPAKGRFPEIPPPDGYTAAGAPIESTLAHGRAVRVPLPLAPHLCYRVIAVAGDGAEDISLALFQDGIEKARDQLSGKRPSVDWCVAETGRLEADITMYEGDGAFAVFVFQRKDTPTAPAKKIRKAGGDGSDFIANRIRQLAPHFARGRRPITEVLRGNISKEEALRIPVTLSGKCITVVAAQAPSLLSLDIRLEREGGPLPGHLNAAAGYAIFVPETCPPKGAYEVVFRPTRGNGDVGAQLFSQ